MQEEKKARLLVRWHTLMESENQAPSFQEFQETPMVRTLLQALEEYEHGLVLGYYLRKVNREARHKLTLILADLETIHEMPVDAPVPFDLVADLIRRVKELQA
jgi:hypothetical protein